MPQGQICILLQNYFCLRFGAAVGLRCGVYLPEQLLLQMLSILRTFHSCTCFLTAAGGAERGGECIYSYLNCNAGQGMVLSGPLQSPCEQRKTLALAVADAVGKVYAARKRYEAAKAHKARNAGKLYDAVLEARKVEREALKILREHIEQHGCAA